MTARHSLMARAARILASTFNTRIASLAKHRCVRGQSLFKRRFLGSLYKNVRVAVKQTCFAMG
jgi:hypothetical protein